MWSNYHHYPAINPKFFREEPRSSSLESEVARRHESWTGSTVSEPEFIMITHFPSPYKIDLRLAALAMQNNQALKTPIIERIIIRIPRDYAHYGDAFPQFITDFTGNNFPNELRSLFSNPQDMIDLITHINQELQESLSASNPVIIIQALMGLLTCWISDTILASTGWEWSKWKLKRLDKWIEGVNERMVCEGICGRIIPLRWSGYLSLDVEVTRIKVD
ncbi:hypothetical protein NADFUDRAFT_53191 [Nadsonia fulvescens var. elongata DSM 6958]|uniref:Ras modification protein ERF4 n=1 Tax=Nadsonia fulvescens var. elongata DSM 6958 TaxID=857566 RepID=A0A1E3PE91_9ASCO|nr:hypothetical protein NADFUDRAFT_53191 [Nadsonia fulvescens var. elongata DSM 6958]